MTTPRILQAEPLVDVGPALAGCEAPVAFGVGHDGAVYAVARRRRGTCGCRTSTRASSETTAGIPRARSRSALPDSSDSTRGEASASRTTRSRRARIGSAMRTRRTSTATVPSGSTSIPSSRSSALSTARIERGSSGSQGLAPSRFARAGPALRRLPRAESWTARYARECDGAGGGRAPRPGQSRPAALRSGGLRARREPLLPRRMPSPRIVGLVTFAVAA
jgi:hypothetical protein